MFEPNMTEHSRSQEVLCLNWLQISNQAVFDRDEWPLIVWLSVISAELQLPNFSNRLG